MNSIIKKRLTQDITVYPYAGIIDGDVNYGTSITLKGFIVPKETVIVSRDGVSHLSKTTIIFDGMDWNRISKYDEVEHLSIGRCPIQKLDLYPALQAGLYELIEVFV